ncbi:WhiB family transcriptional regulator [Streptomyces scopuliridis]
MLYDPERRWVSQASCRTVSSKRFFPQGPPFPRMPPSDTVQAAWDEAKKICSFCPVLAECRRDTLGEEYGVWGGRDEHERFLVRGKLGRAAKKWPEERRLAWGRELRALQQQGVTWTRIRGMTGIASVLGTELIKEYLAAKKAAGDARRGAVVDLPLPELADFPATPGRRHAWVRHNHLVSDAHYRGQTADGQWIYVQLRAGRGESQTWVRAADVHFYNPQPVQILEYIGRGTREESSQQAG